MPIQGILLDVADRRAPREESKQGLAQQVYVLERSPVVTVRVEPSHRQ